MQKYVYVAKKSTLITNFPKQSFTFNCLINLMCYRPKIHYKMANYFLWVNFFKSELLDLGMDSKPFPYEQTNPITLICKISNKSLSKGNQLSNTSQGSCTFGW
jgi:hypothetical protein